MTRKEKSAQREQRRRENLYYRAKNSKDEYLFDVYNEIEKNMPGEVIAVNELRFDESINSDREFDIITKKCIIEIKAKQTRQKLRQFIDQKAYAERKHKKHIVFAPNILKMCKYDYEKNGICVATSLEELITKMREK